MTTFTPEQYRDAADMIVHHWPNAMANHAIVFRDTASRLEAEQSEDAYLDELVDEFLVAFAADDTRAGLRAVLAKLETDGRLVPAGQEQLIGNSGQLPEPDGIVKPRVHNHTPEQGDGLDCPEHRDPEGHLRGRCMTPDGINTPWQTWQEIPEGIWYTCRGRIGVYGYTYTYVNRGGVRYHTDNGDRSTRYEALMRKSAPFHRVPRVWEAGDPEPEAGVTVETAAGVTRTSDGEWWTNSMGHGLHWVDVTEYGPATEVPPEKETDR